MKTIEIDAKALSSAIDALTTAISLLRTASGKPNRRGIASLSDDEAAQRVASGTCLTCSKPPHSRGLCHACRKTASLMVKAGEYTEAELIAANVLLPVRPAGRKAESGFAKHVNVSVEPASAKATARSADAAVPEKAEDAALADAIEKERRYMATRKKPPKEKLPRKKKSQ